LEEQTMFRKIASALIAFPVALLIAASPARAEAQRTAISGTEHMFFGAPGRAWVADDLVQLRDIPLTGTFDFGTLEGTETQVVNARLDPITGDGIVWGTVTYTDSATGVTCSGVRQGSLDNYLITARIVAQCSDGSQLRGTLQDTSVIFPLGAPTPSEVYSDFDGELLDSR
jgi:hypothetical protein